MAGESISSALLIIAAVICAGVLIIAIYPAIFTMAGTFGSATHAADQNIRTDFTIVLATNTTVIPGAGSDPGTDIVTVYMKNVGTARIAQADIINRADVFCGDIDLIRPLGYNSPPLPRPSTPSPEVWTAYIGNAALTSTGYWNPGDTLEVDAMIPTPNEAYFQFVLPNGVSQSVTFSGRTTS
jgi:flagellar protein FlaG